ncbi:MAG: hypothetical protein E7523_06270 [Ruminococcaceae bacterium]|nr:hypothetical protein [Oscillospiraceae bacterium]
MKSPVLIVPGIGFCKVYNGSEETTAWPPALKEDSFMKSLGMRIGKMALFRKDSGFSDMLAQTTQDVLSVFAADETGAHCNGNLFVKSAFSFDSLTDEEKQAQYRLLPVQEICAKNGEENVFVFPYDFSGDPLENGKKLAACVNEICIARGCDKISLLAVGCGSTVVNAYLADSDAANRLDKLVFCFSPLNGSLLLSDLLLDSLDYRKSGSFLCTVMKQQDADMFIELNNMIPGLLENIFDKVFTVVRDLFLNLPAAWALCPSDDYEDLAEELLADKPQLRARTDAFDALRRSLPALLRNLQSNGVNVHILAGSALPFVPLSKSTDVVSDQLVNTSSAALNESIEETAEVAGYVIDTTQACLPEQTVYFPGVSHMQALKNEQVQALLTQILTN